MSEDGRVAFGIAGGACGSDILFHEICNAFNIRTQLLLALPEARFQAESVNRGGADWVMRYQQLCQRVPPRVFADSKDLPHWLCGRKGYDIWQRNNL
ncbi:hypothetical protein [Rhizobium leguminosarum]